MLHLRSCLHVLTLVLAIPVGAALVPVDTSALEPVPATRPGETADGDEAPEEQPAETEGDDDEDDWDELTAPFFFVGAGGGAAIGFPGAQIQPAARGVLGAGFYTCFFYLDGGLDVTTYPAVPFQFNGVGHVGVAIPIPVVHILIGGRIGGGFHWTSGGWGSQITFGAQFGVLLRPVGSRVGVRFTVDGDLFSVPYSGRYFPEVLLTVSLIL